VLIKNTIILFFLFRPLYFNKEEEFYDSIKDKLSKSFITKYGKVYRKFLKNYKNNYDFTLEQKEALVGILLGDGYLFRYSLKGDTRLQIEQSYPEKEEYLFSIFDLYKPLVTNYPKIIVRKADSRTGKIYKSIAFKTATFKCLNKYHDLFYQNRKKIVPNNIHELLTARSLAYWIMDDGGKSYSHQTILHTRAFDKKEVILLQNALEKNFELKTRIEEKTENQWVIYIPIRQKVPLIKIVKPYMHKSMLYKIE